MGLVRAPIDALAPGDLTLDAWSSHYLTRVLRLGVGTTFVAFDPARAIEADATVILVDHTAARVRVGPLRKAGVVATREITLVQGLAKGDKCDAIVRDATELGATRCVMAITARSVVKLDPARALSKNARWTKIAREAARQCGRGDPPTIDGPLPWEEALAAVPLMATRFCLYENATARLGPALVDALAEDTRLAFAVGPEGGLTTEEVAIAEASGWLVVSLGPFILRTETVAAAVLGAVRITSR